MNKLQVCRGETPKFWQPVNADDDDDIVTATGDEMADEAIQDGITVEGQPDNADERSADL